MANDFLKGKSLRNLVSDESVSKPTVIKSIYQTLGKLPTNLQVARMLKPTWSGVLVVDGKYIRVFDQYADEETSRGFKHKQCWIIGVDCSTGDIPHEALASEETMIDLVMFFKYLKSIGYPLKVLVSDGNSDILRAAKLVYKKPFDYQLCVYHFVKGLPQTTQRLKDLVNRINWALNAKYSNDCFGRILDIFEREKKYRSKEAKEIFKKLRNSLGDLTCHFKYDGSVPRTSNPAELTFRELDLRLERFGIFHNFKSASAWLHTWSLKRRTTAFTDSRDKSKNKKSPLELARCKAVERIFKLI